MGVLEILLLIASVIMIILSLLQSGKSDGLNAFGGSDGLNLFTNVKERGSEKVISNVTMVTGIIFFVLVVVIRIMN